MIERLRGWKRTVVAGPDRAGIEGSREMRRERGEHTLQATALVHEAYLKMFGATTDWEDRAHFLAIAAITMRVLDGPVPM